MAAWTDGGRRGDEGVSFFRAVIIALALEAAGWVLIVLAAALIH